MYNSMAPLQPVFDLSEFELSGCIWLSITLVCLPLKFYVDV